MLYCCGDATSRTRLAELRQRGEAVVALERAIADYVAAGGGLPVVVVVCPVCAARSRARRKVKGDGGKKAA